MSGDDLVCYVFHLGDRNKVVFGRNHGSLEDVFLNLQLKTFEWINGRDKELAVDWNSWMVDPFGL